GRSFNSTVVKQNSFDHSKTGFTLHGAHARLACTKCHTEYRSGKPIRQDAIRFFGKTETCVGCHKKDDVHAFPPKWAAKDCNACHNDKTWKEAA
ncbi:hypothetical protein, partial [Clostridium perfringens]|uniref:hypothetical protein n=1 Tax=Clostridium perfringens TaxID=1502 RepID=UPI0037543687